MSELQKKMFKQKMGKPPKQDQEDDSNDEEEESKDQMPEQGQSNFSGPIMPTQSFQMPNLPKSQQKSKKNYDPRKWEEFYENMEYLNNGTSVFSAGSKGVVFLCLHGAGHSAQSFALMAKEVKRWATCVAFDFRGHGHSKIEQNTDDLSLNTLICDTIEVFKYTKEKYPEQNIIIVGHSMGGSIACKTCQRILEENDQEKRLQGLVVIDVVEGTALDALPFMEQIVMQRPKSFQTLQQAIQWSIRSNTLKNLESARVSIPPQLVEIKNDQSDVIGYSWKVDLMKSQNHWVDWFKGLTQSFLGIRIPKLLLLAEKDRMDKDLTIAQMQGKFRLEVIYNVGHVMQEDDPVKTARSLYELVDKFKIPQTVQELESISTIGIGKFHPKLLPFNE